MTQIKKNQKISQCLWFDDQAEEAANFYTSIFNNSKIGTIARYSADTPSNKPKGSVLTVVFEISGNQFTALNGGPEFKPNPSISFFVVCETVEETDSLWQKLSEKGNVLMPLDKYDWSEKYGWVQDRFRISWQISVGKIADTGQKITPSLLFTGEKQGKAEDAIRFYNSVFKTSDIEGILKYGEGEEVPPGFVKHAQFHLEGQTFMAMDSGVENDFPFSEAISFVVNCETQEEVDDYWEKLSAVPESEQCGWLKDKFGVSWQIIPKALIEMMNDQDTKKSKRVMEAMLQMKKIDIKGLKQAYQQE